MSASQIIFIILGIVAYFATLWYEYAQVLKRYGDSVRTHKE